MKKLLLVYSLLLLSFSAYSQIEKNTFMAGGSVSFYSNGNEGHPGYGHSTFQLNSKVGYFALKNFALGLGFNLFRYGSHYNSYAVSPFIRYYIKNVYSELNYSYGKHSFVPNGSFSNSSGGIAIGYVAFLNKNVALEPSMFYHTSFNDSGQSFGLMIGLQIYFNR